MAHTAKTDKVMRLFGEEKAAVNPAVKPPEREAVPPVFVKSNCGFQLVNVAFLLINEQVGGIMERFNCCMCEKCAGAVVSEALKALPARYIRVRKKSDEAAVNEAAAELRTTAIKVITKAVIAVKANPPHGENRG